MDTRIKERLVGAIVLVAIVVIVVPELLTGQRSAPTPASVPGTVPVRTVTIDLATPERAAIARLPPAAVPATPPAAPATSPPAESPPEPRLAPESAAAAPAEPVTATLERPSPGPPAVAAKPAAAPGAAAPAATSIAAPPRPSAIAHRGEAWVVQLGSFARRENAERLASNLRAKSYSAFVSEFRGSGRVLFRVRVGPEQDRARADAIAARLAREGHRGSVAPES